MDEMKLNDRGMIVKAADYMDMPVENDRVIRVIATKEIADRDGDVISVAGIDLTEYNENPVVLWMHDQSECPVGKCIGLEKTLIDGVPAMIAEIEFAETEDGNEIAYLYKNGFLNAVSICFIPTENEPRRVDGQIVGWAVNKCKLIEISAVNIPANQASLLIKSLAKQGMEMNALKQSIETKQTEQDEAIEKIQQKLAAIAGTIKGGGSAPNGVSGDIYAEIFKLAASIEKKKE